MKKILIFLLNILFVSSLAAKTFIREYSYQAGEADSKLSARAIALEQVKRLLLEEVGVYISSSLEIQTIEISNEVKELTKQDIEVISAGITETKIVSEKWNGEVYWLKAEIQLDENDVLQRLENLVNNNEYKKAIEDSRKETDAALAEIEKLRIELEHEKDKNKQVELQKAYITETEKLSAADLYQKGSDAFFKNDLQQASTYLQESLKLDPNSKNTWYTLAILNDMNSDYGQAIRCYNKVLELDPHDVNAMLGLGNTYREKQDFNQAILYYNQTLKIDPKNYIAYLRLSGVYEDMGSYAEAIACLEEMLKLGDVHDYENKVLARLYEIIGDYPNASKYYLMAAESEPTNPDILFYLGCMYSSIGDYSQAIVFYQKSLALQPDKAMVLDSLGKAYLYLGDIENSKKCFDKAQKLWDEGLQGN